MLSQELAALFARDITRLIQELQAFPDTAAVWKTAPGVANAAGTIVLHLEGSCRHFIGFRLGQIAYTRQRPLEFSARGIEQGDLIARLEAIKEMVPRVIAGLSESDLDAEYPEVVLDKPMPTRQWLIHLLGHLNYHLGQVDYLRRFLTGNAAIELAGL
jgi:uncharacterized damage-inducible protein DinB